MLVKLIFVKVDILLKSQGKHPIAVKLYYFFNFFRYYLLYPPCRFFQISFQGWVTGALTQTSSEAPNPYNIFLFLGMDFDQ